MSDYEREYSKEQQEERRRADRLTDDALDRWAQAHPREETPTEAEPTQPQCNAVKPGNFYAGQAYKNGCEDDYINKMRERFGEEW